MSGRRGRNPRRNRQHPPPKFSPAQPTMQFMNQAQLIQQQQQHMMNMARMSVAYANPGYGMPPPFVYGMNPMIPAPFYPGMVGYPVPPGGMYQPVYTANHLPPNYVPLPPDDAPEAASNPYQVELIDGAENMDSPHPIWTPPKDQPQPPRLPVAPREKKVLTFIDPNTQEAVTFDGGDAEKRTASTGSSTSQPPAPTAASA